MSGFSMLYNTTVVDRSDIAIYTDRYFNTTRAIIAEYGDCDVIHAVFVRTPTIFSPKIVTGWLRAVAEHNNCNIKIESAYTEGDRVPLGEAQYFITGRASETIPTETIFLQKIGPVSVGAFNASACCEALPHVPFIAMGARHSAGTEMQEQMDYAAAVGGRVAQKEFGAKGFVAGASDVTAPFFGRTKGTGTMPHALIGYFGGSTLKAAKAYRAMFPDEPFTVLPDYNGLEVTDALEVAKAFPAEAASGELAFRLDTNGGRFLEGLDEGKSYEVLKRNAKQLFERTWSDDVWNAMIGGKGVSAAAVWFFKEKMIEAGFPNIRIMVSSGFGPEKCRIMRIANAPLDGVGTGSYFPKDYPLTYTTADIIRYGDKFEVKSGRTHLIDQYKEALPRLKIVS